MIRARYPNANPEFGFGPPLQAKSWTAPTIPIQPSVEVRPATPNRTDSYSFICACSAYVPSSCHVTLQNRCHRPYPRRLSGWLRRNLCVHLRLAAPPSLATPAPRRLCPWIWLHRDPRQPMCVCGPPFISRTPGPSPRFPESLQTGGARKDWSRSRGPTEPSPPRTCCVPVSLSTSSSPSAAAT